MSFDRGQPIAVDVPLFKRGSCFTDEYKMVCLRVRPCVLWLLVVRIKLGSTTFGSSSRCPFNASGDSPAFSCLDPVHQ